MSLLSEYGVSVPRGKVAFTGKEAFEVAKNIGSKKIVIKAQVLAGGRGKGHFLGDPNVDFGGVQVAQSPQDAQEKSDRMIGKNLITKQTGKDGRPCNSVV